jgi:hypothetical protein
LLVDVLQAAIADTAAKSRKTSNCGAYCRTGTRAATTPNQNRAIINTMAYKTSGDCGHTLRGNRGADEAVCGVVVMESETFALLDPAGSVAGENKGLAFGGSPVAVNITVPASVPFEGATANVKLAGWPAGTVEAGVEAFTLKSGTVTWSAVVVPPPGDGLLTVTFSVPLCVKSLAGSTAVSEVELTKVVVRGEPFS